MKIPELTDEQIFDTDNIIRFLESKDPNESYNYMDVNGECCWGQYIQSFGIDAKRLAVNGRAIRIYPERRRWGDSETHIIPPMLRAFVVPTRWPYGHSTFGAALRNLKQLVEETAMFSDDGNNNGDLVTYQKIGSFKTKFNRLLKSKTPTQVLMRVTPEMAEAMLEQNIAHNRPINEAYIREDLIPKIKTGQWNLTNQGIGFDTNGDLCDGQHRLWACILSQEPIDTWVAFGLHEKTKFRVDTGYKRTPGQIVGMSGYKHGALLAPAIKFCMWYDEEVILMTTSTLGLRRVYQMGRGRTAEYDKIIKYAHSNPSLPQMTEHLQMYHKFRALPGSLLLGLHWLISQKYPRKGQEFFEKLCYGEGLVRNDPIWKLRDRLQRIKDRKELVVQAHKAAFVVKTFNAWNKGQDIGLLKIHPGEEFPRIK